MELDSGVLDNYVGSTPVVVDSAADDPSGSPVGLPPGSSSPEPYVVRNADLTVFSLHTNGDLFAFSGYTMQQVDSGVQTILLGPDGTLYALVGGSLYSAAVGSTSLNLFRNKPQANNVQGLVQNANGNLYELANGSLYVLQAGSSWTQVQSGIESISWPRAGMVNVVKNDGESWRYSGVAGGLLGGPRFKSWSVQPTAPAAGQSVTVTLDVLDDFGNPLTSYNGTVQFTSSDAAAIAAGGPLPDHTFAATDDGAFTFTTTFLTAGTQTIAATDGSGDSGSTSLTVSPADTAGQPILFSVDPPPVTAGQKSAHGHRDRLRPVRQRSDWVCGHGRSHQPRRQYELFLHE